MNAKVLIVDDSSLARRNMRSIVEELGHISEEAKDGAQALERYFVSKPDVVILDMVMTGMYGLEVLEKLRALDPAAKVIVATADIQKSTIEQVRAAGAAAFLNKPVAKQALVSALSTVLSGGHTWN